MSKLVRIQSSKSVIDWQSPGVQLKPEFCRQCPLCVIGKSFCPDYVPENPRIAFILDVPGKDAAIEKDPFAGASGYLYTKLFIEEMGYKKEDVLLSHVIRCVQPPDSYGKQSYPTGWKQKQAELNCRHYDNALLKFDPNLFVLTLHPRDMLTVGAHRRQIQRDVSKAFYFASAGYRPAILFGLGPSELYYPWLRGNGGMKTFRGHWWLGESPFKDYEKNKNSLGKKLFIQG